MLDQQHRDLSLVANARPQRGALGWIAPARRFVQQQELWLGGESAGEFHTLAGAQWQAVCRPKCHILEVEQLKERPRVLDQSGFLAADPGKPQRIADKIAAAFGVTANQHIVDNRLRAEERQILKRTSDADL